MPQTTIRGCTIHYEVLGLGGPWVALTPGGRNGMQGIRGLAERLAPSHRALIYDRRNCGASDVIIGGALSEQEEWAEDLYELLRQVATVPAYVGGSSAGCRVSLLLAIRHPDAIKALLLTAVSGGQVAAERLGYNYYGQFIEAAQRGGMQAVMEMPFFAERIEQNPSNRERLLAMNPNEFRAIMARWRAFFTADKPIIGATEAELRAIEAPAIIMPGNDEVHPRAVGENLHRIMKRSELVPQLLTEAEVATLRDHGGAPAAQAERTARLAPFLLDFLTRQEQAVTAAAPA